MPLRPNESGKLIGAAAMTSPPCNGLDDMTRFCSDLTMSLDGFVAGPNQTMEEPLGAGGEELHRWLVRLATWREQHGLPGGEHNADSEAYDWHKGTGASGDGPPDVQRRLGAVGERSERRRLVG